MSTPLPFPGALKQGAPKSTGVEQLQRLLQSQGFYTFRVDGVFGPKTFEALHAFQATHMGPDREYLRASGVLDKATWWALQNPSGTPQRSNLSYRIPEGVTGMRRKLLEVCVSEHQKGVAEDPDGSNWGDGVSKYLEGVGPAYWCAYCVSWLVKEATGSWPMGVRIGLVRRFWQLAKQKGLAIDIGPSVVPQPGDIGVYLYTNSQGRQTGLGHIFVVAGVAPDGRRINTFGGNEGNRFKLGVRSTRPKDLVGYIRLFPALTEKWERRLVDAGEIQSDSSATR